MSRTELTFRSHGEDCAAWHYPAESEHLSGPAGRPCVVMAHGFGATHDTGLEPFAEAFARAGLDTLAFDYRGFGASQGRPRQVVDIPGQLGDYRAAVATARGFEGVDPERIVLWGVSFAGGHVFPLAADDPRIAAAIALTPATDGLAAARMIARREGVLGTTKSAVVGLRDLLALVTNRRPVRVPLAGLPGSIAALTAPGALESYTAIAGATWRNEVAARAFLRLPTYRPGRHARRVECPLLVQVADLDQSAPPGAAVAAGSRAPHAEVRHYPCDHFDVYAGKEWHERVVAHQVTFLTRQLSEVAPEEASRVRRNIRA